MGSNRTFCIQQMGKPQKEKKVGDRYNVLRKGKVIFWDVSESELFNILEDLAVECYYNKTLTSSDITYEPYICLLYTSPSPRDRTRSRMPSSA